MSVQSANLLVADNYRIKVAGDVLLLFHLLPLLSPSFNTSHADFGTARLVKGAMQADKQDPITDQESLLLTRNVGTILWTAPEILEQQPYGLSCDVFR